MQKITLDSWYSKRCNSDNQQEVPQEGDHGKREYSKIKGLQNQAERHRTGAGAGRWMARVL